MSQDPGQDPDEIHADSYFAVNLIWEPVDRLYCGIEYLYGTRTNISGEAAQRLSAALPCGLRTPHLGKICSPLRTLLKGASVGSTDAPTHPAGAT